MATRETTLIREILKVDPNFLRDKRKEVEYVMSNGRVFSADPETRGAYADD